MKLHYSYLLTGLLTAAFLFAVVYSYTRFAVTKELENATLALDAAIAKQELVLTNIADLTKQNNADEITEKIVVDCQPTERARFDVLLGKLSNQITPAELSELDTLFFRCGRFYADRKAVMAARLVREVSVYKEYIALRDRVLNTNDSLSDRVTLWQRVADDELTLANSFASLVDAQRDIIMALLAGKQANSPEVASTLTKVTETKNNMTVTIKQIENARSELSAI
jgi:hypothetical protein